MTPATLHTSKRGAPTLLTTKHGRHGLIAQNSAPVGDRAHTQGRHKPLQLSTAVQHKRMRPSMCTAVDTTLQQLYNKTTSPAVHKDYTQRAQDVHHTNTPTLHPFPMASLSEKEHNSRLLKIGWRTTTQSVSSSASSTVGQSQPAGGAGQPLTPGFQNALLEHRGASLAGQQPSTLRLMQHNTSLCAAQHS